MVNFVSPKLCYNIYECPFLFSCLLYTAIGAVSSDKESWCVYGGASGGTTLTVCSTAGLHGELQCLFPD